MKRKHKTYSKPKRPFDKARIDEEAIIKKEYGLKNKREIWKADAKIRSIRSKAKKLIGESKEEQEVLFNRLKKNGFDVNTLGEVLSLDKSDYLKRRLQSITSKKLKITVKTARQMITHRKILVDGKAIDAPSYIVPVKFENKITVKESKTKKVGEKPSEVPEEERAEENINDKITEQEVKETAAETEAAETKE